MKYKIITFGCAMNKSDAERVVSVLNSLGFKEAIKDNQADLIIVLACSVRQTAIDRIYGLKRKFEQLRKKRPLITILTGCVIESDKPKMLEFFNEIICIKDIKKLPKILNYYSNLFSCSFFSFPAEKTEEYLDVKPEYESKFQALVPIMNGCNNYCTYCVVPYVRGREISRPAVEIIKECENLIALGYKEITLLGQNVNSYKDGKVNFPKLLKKIDAIKGDFWIRFVSSHPKDLSDELIKAMGQGRHIAPHLNLAVQSGDNQILKKMNRKYTASHYKKLIIKLKKEIPEIAISTDVIVGFPGETEKQFQNTAKLFKEIKFDMAYISQYSVRAKTAAAKLDDNVLKIEKKRRDKFLSEILKRNALENNKKFIGKHTKVLVSSYKDGYCYGKNGQYKSVKFAGKGNLVGQFVNVKIKHCTSWGLGGEKEEPKVVVILGTTASGKTKLAVTLAKKYNGEIISADSRQVYRGMDLGTGKDLDEYVIKNKNSKLKVIPHHFIDIISPKKQYTVAKYQQDAFRTIADILARGKLPIICGGTGLYIEAVTKGYRFGSLSSKDQSSRIRKKLTGLTLKQLLAKLKKIDPKTYQFIDKKNRRRVQRVLEIFYETGVQKSKLPKPQEPPYKFLQIGITYPREVLDAQIKERLNSRIKAGMLQEVAKLQKLGVSWKQLEAFGLEYRWISRYLRGTISLEVMEQELFRAVRNFSKRQLTWFKKNKDIIWENDYKKIENLVKKFLRSY